MSLEHGFLQELDGKDPDGFVYSLDRRGLGQRIIDFLSSIKKPTPDFRNLPDDTISIFMEENEEY